MFGNYFGKTYFGGTYWGPASGVTPTASGHSQYYSEFSEYSLENGKLEQRFPWGKRKRANKQDEQDIEDILSALPWDKLK